MKRSAFFLSVSLVFFGITAFAKTAEEESLSRYLSICESLSHTLGPSGSWQKGEIEISTALPLIKKIEQQVKERLIKKGIDPRDAEKWSTVGIVAEDQ